MAGNLRILSKEEVENDFNRVCDQLRIGDAYDGMWGTDTIQLYPYDITALQAGEVLYTQVCGEYGILIKLTPEG